VRVTAGSASSGSFDCARREVRAGLAQDDGVFVSVKRKINSKGNGKYRYRDPSLCSG
jgi:hypothetical protein